MVAAGTLHAARRSCLWCALTPLPPLLQLYEYTVSIADEGREGTFMALGNVPTFVATLLAGGMSGYLLSTYCPPNPPRHSVRAAPPPGRRRRPCP